MTDKRIIWQKANERQYVAYNDKDEKLGFLNYESVGSHMHWCWYQKHEIRMSPGCLQEVRDKQKELLKTKRK